MKHLQELNRNRPLKIYNLLPEEISKKELPAFFVQSSIPYIDWDQIVERRNNIFNPKEANSPRKSSTKKKDRSPTRGRLSSTGSLESKRTARQTSFFPSSPSISEYQKLHTEAKPTPFIPYSINNNGLFDKECDFYMKGCVTCGKDNIQVNYFGERHICLRCRNFLKTINNDKAYAFLDDAGNIKAFGEKEEKYYEIDIDKIWFNDHRCYATLAGEDELILLLHDDQSLKKNWS